MSAFCKNPISHLKNLPNRLHNKPQSIFTKQDTGTAKNKFQRMITETKFQISHVLFKKKVNADDLMADSFGGS